MHILYVGPISLDVLSEALPLGVKLEDRDCRFDLGAHEVLGFLKAGHRVTVLKQTPLVGSPCGYAAPNFALRLFPARSSRAQYYGLYHQEVKVLSAAIREARPDVVFANWPYQFARAALVSGFPTLVIAHDSPWRILWQMRDKARLLRTLYSQLLVMPRTRYMTGVSPYILEDVPRTCLYRRKMRCIPNAVTAPVPDVCPKEIRKDAETILAVSEWGRRKNMAALLQAFVPLRKRHPAWRLVVCGRHLGRGEDAERFMAERGLPTDGVEFRGFQTRKQLDAALADEADVFCSPTREESFGLVFAEAMAQGVPCVGGERSGAVPWVMGEGGVTCDVTRPEKLAECLERVMLDLELRRNLSAKGLARVKSEFSLDTCVARYLDALACVAAGGKGW